MITESQLKAEIRREIRKAETRLKKVEKEAADAKKEAAKLKKRLDRLIAAVWKKRGIDDADVNMIG